MKWVYLLPASALSLQSTYGLGAFGGGSVERPLLPANGELQTATLPAAAPGELPLHVTRLFLIGTPA